jgi:hypothetical protein
MDFSDHVFTTMFEALSNALAAIVGKYAAVIGIVSPALRIGIVIYISLLGYAIMRGAVQYPFREYAYRGCQLAFLYFAVTSLYGSQIGMFALGGLARRWSAAMPRCRASDDWTLSRSRISPSMAELSTTSCEISSMVRPSRASASRWCNAPMTTPEPFRNCSSDARMRSASKRKSGQSGSCQFHRMIDKMPFYQS